MGCCLKVKGDQSKVFTSTGSESGRPGMERNMDSATLQLCDLAQVT